MSIKQRLLPDSASAAVMVEHCHHARFLFNIGLEQRSLWTRDRHNRGTHPERGPLDANRVTTASQMRELADLRKDLTWLAAGSSSVQQAALRDLDRAFTNFFKGRASYPVFKRRDDRNGGFVIRDLTVIRLNKKWGEVTIPKAGRVRFRITRSWADIAAATSARVTMRNNTWSISFTTPPPVKTVAATGAIVGIDRGVANTIALSDGTMLTIPGLSAGEQARFLALEQRLARQTRTAKKHGRRLSECTNRAKTLNQMAVLRRRLDNRRTDWVEQTTTNLARTYDRVAVENLNTTAMTKRPAPKPDPDQPGVFLPNQARAKAALARLILGSRWSQITTRLSHKMAEPLIVVPAAYSSQECRQCHHIASENRQSQAVFSCTRCGHINHADTNAAQVIEHRGLTILDKTAPKQAHAPAPNPGTPGARLHKPRHPSRRRNPTEGTENAT